MDNTWYRDIETKVLTILKYKLEKKLKSKFPSIDITNKEETSEYPKFPSVFLHTLPTMEMGADLEGTSINAVMASFQITVTTNTNQSDTNLVMDNCVAIMKSLGFQINRLPELNSMNKKQISIMRCRRVVGANDKL